MILALLIAVGGIAVMFALGWGMVVAGLRAGDQVGEFRLPVGIPARRYLLTAVVGQTGGRLRVFRVPVVSERPARAGRPARAARAGDRG